MKYLGTLADARQELLTQVTKLSEALYTQRKHYCEKIMAEATQGKTAILELSECLGLNCEKDIISLSKKYYIGREVCVRDYVVLDYVYQNATDECFKEFFNNQGLGFSFPLLTTSTVSCRWAHCEVAGSFANWYFLDELFKLTTFITLGVLRNHFFIFFNFPSNSQFYKDHCYAKDFIELRTDTHFVQSGVTSPSPLFPVKENEH